MNGKAIKLIKYLATNSERALSERYTIACRYTRYHRKNAEKDGVLLRRDINENHNL